MKLRARFRDAWWQGVFIYTDQGRPCFLELALFSMTLFGCCSDVSEELLRAKRRDWERSKERSTTAPLHHGPLLHRVREARGLNRSSFVAQQQSVSQS